MKDSALAVQPARETSVRQVEAADLSKRINDLHNSVASRAFEIFDGNGRQNGHDLADWLQAEVEFLHPLHIGISESSKAITVRAEVPGFKPNELQVSVEPHRLTITGQRETTKQFEDAKTTYSETCSDQILRVLELPAAVDPAKVATTLKDGVLELNMPKAVAAKEAKGGTQTV